MNYQNRSLSQEFEEIEVRLLRNAQTRQNRGALYQDYKHNGREEGEIFFGNLTEKEYADLPLKCKRKAGPARTIDLYSKPYEEVYKGDKGEGKGWFTVYVHTFELETLGIKYDKFD